MGCPFAVCPHSRHVARRCEGARYGCRVARGRSRNEPVERPADLDPIVPFPPMEAELVRELPAGEEWQYEPKWDGFRGLLENTTGELRLWSRNARPLLRYFPELAPLAELLPPRSAVDGEIVIVRERRARLRRHADAAPPGGEPRAQALGRDPRDVRRLRPSRLGRRAALAGAARGAPRRARVARVRVRSLPDDARPRRGRSNGSRSSSRSAWTA